MVLPICVARCAKCFLTCRQTVPLPQGGLMSLKTVRGHLACSRRIPIRFVVCLGHVFYFHPYLDLDFTPFATSDLVCHRRVSTPSLTKANADPKEKSEHGN